VFRGKRGSLLKILWHDGVGMSLYARRLETGRSAGGPSTGRPADPPHHPAHAEGRRGRDPGGAAGLHAGGDRLAERAARATGPGAAARAPDPAARIGGIIAGPTAILLQVPDSMQ
jgi:hypothetical protein